VLADASAAVRAYTGQTISAATTTARTRVRWGEARLSQRPVTTVDEAAAVDGTVLTGWEWDGLDRLTGLTDDVVDITYTHGWEPVPDDVIGVVCAIAARSLPGDADPGIVSEAIAGYSYTRGSVTAAGPWGMFTQEQQILDRYRRPGGTARLAVGYR
jgi:hypothetical protein